MTSKFICLAIEIYTPSKFLHSNKDFLEKVFPAIIRLTKDNSPDARYYARTCLNMLWPEPNYKRTATRVLKDHLYTDAKEAVETLMSKVWNKILWMHSMCAGALRGGGAQNTKYGSVHRPLKFISYLPPHTYNFYFHKIYLLRSRQVVGSCGGD